MIAKPHGYVALHSNLNDVWFVAEEYLAAFGQPHNLAKLYKAARSTCPHPWIDKLDFSSGRPTWIAARAEIGGERGGRGDSGDALDG